jgi:protein N-lysine methyltransferase METTL21D
VNQLACSQTLVLLAYKERDSAERKFWCMLKDKGIILKKLESIAGIGGTPIEIWLGKPVKD